MDRNFGFDRLARSAAASMALSVPAVSTALAEELYYPGENTALGVKEVDAPLRTARSGRSRGAPDKAAYKRSYRFGFERMLWNH